jgi:guanylate kinase
MIVGPDTGTSVEITRIQENGKGKISEEEFIELIENEEFLETFNTFYYPDSTVKDARTVDSEQSMLYVILETVEKFEEVENYYKNKKVQSIWSRDFIYQKSMAEVEEEFIEEDEDVPISKFTFSSKDRDRVVDILVKDLDTGRTQIMITCWNLQ